MPDPTNDNDIDALLDLLAAQSRFGFHAALTALVAEREGLRAENEAQSYEGNSAAHWAASSKVYGNCISDCWKVLMLAGFPPNGNIDIVAALTALVAERDALRKRVAELESHNSVSVRLLLAERDALRKRVEELESQNPSDGEVLQAIMMNREAELRLVSSALAGIYSNPNRVDDPVRNGQTAAAAAKAALDAMGKGER
jgi:hypothetical protein